jgi:adenylate cyclase
MSTKENVTRKLRAILSADVKGYSLLMSDDEAFTIKTLKSYRTLMSEHIEKHTGRIVDASGDNLLAEFASAVDAVECAVEIQKNLKEKNEDLPLDKRLEFRIGVNIADVIQDGDSLYGEGVNIAARIEGLAEAGGICISRNAYDQVKDKVQLGFEYLGGHNVKNIREPIRVYKVLMESDTPTDLAIKPLDIPVTPSIAVLPFVNMSGDTEQDYFSDGITEEIITSLSKLPKMFVIASNSSFTYKGMPIKVQKVSEELGVRYVLEGSVRKAGTQIRITAQLVDAVTGRHLWAERYDRNMGDVFALQDEISMEILNAIELKLTEGEQALLFRKGTSSLQVYLKFLQAVQYIRNQNPEDNFRARQILEEVISLDPNYAIAYRQLGTTHIMDVWLDTSKSHIDSFKKAEVLIKKAMDLDATEGSAYSLLGNIRIFQKDWDTGIELMQHAVELEPNGAECHAYLGMGLKWAERAEDAIVILKKAIRLNPIPPSWYLYNLAAVYSGTGQYEKAIIYAKKAVQISPDLIFSHIYLTQCYGFAGQEKEAQAEVKEVLRIKPNFSLDRYSKTLPYKDPNTKKRVLETLRYAGLK